MIAALQIRQERLVESLVPHPAVDVDEHRTGALDHDGHRLKDEHEDLREDQGEDQADGGTRVVRTGRRHHRSQHPREERAGDADDLRGGAHDDRDQGDDAEGDPEAAAGQPPGAHESLTEGRALQHERRGDQKQLRAQPDRERDRREPGQHRRENRESDQVRIDRDQTCGQAEAETEDDSDQHEAEEDRECGEAEQPPDRRPHPTPQLPERGLLADRGEADVGGDHALHERDERGRGEPDEEGDDDVPGDRAGQQRLEVRRGGRHRLQAGEGREQRERDRRRRGDHHEQLHHDGEAEEDLRVVPERGEGAPEDRPEGHRVQGNDAPLGSRGPGLSAHSYPSGDAPDHRVIHPPTRHGRGHRRGSDV
ncbi:hypothetical protein [Microbacterium sp. NIBRBAC000506063]|uniref:hypothetical protein n=1 Tax=Microbacterium sp. NIBRBAC000506063 TaxID=2734618 RepID=UPI001BB62D93|nr:hypothetical protein [Microbacterium sp. NIBRBAC000506063]QTV79414.1 hypothetical protein KAE78_10770 [Microbacterium sp. NIBRBAC000506063]